MSKELNSNPILNYIKKTESNPVYQVSLAKVEKQDVSLSLQESMFKYLFRTFDKESNSYIKPDFQLSLILSFQLGDYALNSYWNNIKSISHEYLNMFLFKHSYNTDNDKNIYQYLGCGTKEEMNYVFGGDFLNSIAVLNQSINSSLQDRYNYPYPYNNQSATLKSSKDGEAISLITLGISMDLLSSLNGVINNKIDWFNNAIDEEKMVYKECLDEFSFVLDTHIGVSVKNPNQEYQNAVERLNIFLMDSDKLAFDIIIENLEKRIDMGENLYIRLDDVQNLKDKYNFHNGNVFDSEYEIAQPTPKSKKLNVKM